MEKDFILSEAEMSVAVTRIQGMIDFLLLSMEEYSQCMSRIQGEGIKDELICADISKVERMAMKHKPELEKISEKLGTVMNSACGQVEENDNFSFPFDLMTEVTNLLSKII